MRADVGLAAKAAGARRPGTSQEEMNMCSARSLTLMALCLGPLVLLHSAARAQDGDGLSLPGAARAHDWSHWQGRVALSMAEPGYRSLGAANGGLKLRSLSLMGDFYFAGTNVGAPGQGFRATSGLVIGNRASWSLADGAALGATGRSVLVERRDRLSLSMPALPDAAADTAAVPYVGVGYTGAWARSGWGFSADLGLMALSPASAVKLGRVPAGPQSLDDMLRDLRLSPVLQLGVSYSF